MRDNFLTACKSFLFGEKCSLCNKKMQRTVDSWYSRQSWEIFLEYECKPCQSYIRARNYTWVNKGFNLIHEHYLYVSSEDPTNGDIYTPFIQGLSVSHYSIPLNGINITAQDIDKANKIVERFLLLS
jgi:hypothetical protein